MSPEAERELISAVARIEATSTANHSQTVREIDRMATEMTKLVAQGEEREKMAQAREARLQVEIHGIQNWQLEHPHDRGAHPDVRSEIGDLATVVAVMQDNVLTNTKRLADYAAEHKARSEIWGLQYKGLAFGLAACGTVTAILTALGAI